VTSFVKRKEYGIMQAYREGILMVGQQQSASQIATDYLDTVACNISLFLKDKTHTMAFSVENANSDFIDFWHWIGAREKLENALGEWQVCYNASY
jgi:hypothetical protein